MSYPPKHSLNPVLRVVDFQTSLELCHTKVRYALRDDLGPEPASSDPCTEDLHLSKESTLSMEIRDAEARSRAIFNVEDSTLDLRKRKVTDLQQNNRVFLPPPLNKNTEAGLVVRSGEMLKTINVFCDIRNSKYSVSIK